MSFMLDNSYNKFQFTKNVNEKEQTLSKFDENNFSQLPVLTSHLNMEVPIQIIRLYAFE